MNPSFYTKYLISDFYYELPSNLIASYPIQKRTDSRLLCLNKNTGIIEHKNFKAILELINPGDLLILNDTKVIPARLFAHKKTGAKVEILLERILRDDHILAHLKSSKTLKIGTELCLRNGIQLKILSKVKNLFELQFLVKVDSILDLLDQIGHIPLPPYFRRAAETIDIERYQTIYAQIPGSIAAPTAGLHFDKDLLNCLQEKGVDIAFVTLHVGAGTFQPIYSENIKDHLMHSEMVTVSSSVCEKIIKTKKQGKRVIAVGTTTVRSLETASIKGSIQPYHGETRLFIYPNFTFRCVDALITNFHLPKSTLLMLVCAFGSYKYVMAAYQQAIVAGYRFFSYGDAFWCG